MSTLQDMLQGASRTFWADGLGAPADMGNTLLNLLKAGYGYAGNKAGLLKPDQMPELVDKPVGGSAWIADKMRDRGLLKDNPGSTGDLFGVLAGSLLPMGVQAKAPQIAAGVNRMVANAAAPTSGINAQRGAIVYHGSPHKFDKFDSSKIGTGEGAQAYGHGLYLAEDPRVAQSYKEALSAGNGASDADTIARVLDAVGGDGAKAAAEFERRARYANIPGGKEKLLALADQARAGVDPRGSLYKVDLPDEQIARMLDWDKPLSQQPPDVQSALKLAGVDIPDASAVGKTKQSADAAFDAWIAAQRSGSPLEANALKKKWQDAQAAHDKAKAGLGRTGADAYKDFQFQGRDWALEANKPAMTTMAASQAKASEYLRAFGVPGIRYLDGGSRGAGQGSSNFVVFPQNESLLRILQRNGQDLPSTP